MSEVEKRTRELEKSKLDYYIGVLSGLAWAALIDEKLRPIAEAIDVVVDGLEKIRKGDTNGG